MKKFSPEKRKKELASKKRYELLKDDETFEKRVMELCNEEEKKRIEEMKQKLGWVKLPYKNLEELIDWINYPKNVSKESIALLKLIGKKVYNELCAIEDVCRVYSVTFDRKRLEHLFAAYKNKKVNF
jgi:hypothetical protein